MWQLISEQSVLRRAGQAWKLRLALVGLLLGGGLMLWAQWRIAGLTAEQFTVLILSGVVVALASLFGACLAIRCPACGSKWLWQAVREKHSSSWLAWLLEQKTCPTCGATAAAT
jgi:hypothetical protein